MKKVKDDLDQKNLEEQEEQPYIRQNSIISTIEPGFISLAFSKEELATLTNLLDISAKTFESLALQAAQQNDEESYKVLAARYKLSNHFVSKLIEFYKMPEPLSRELH